MFEQILKKNEQVWRCSFLCRLERTLSSLSGRVTDATLAATDIAAASMPLKPPDVRAAGHCDGTVPHRQPPAGRGGDQHAAREVRLLRTLGSAAQQGMAANYALSRLSSCTQMSGVLCTLTCWTGSLIRACASFSCQVRREGAQHAGGQQRHVRGAVHVSDGGMGGRCGRPGCISKCWH